MEAPHDPMTGPDRSQDTFDFTQGTPGLPADLARQLRETAESLTGMGAEQRRHLTIAMTAVGATWIAPVLAARRRRKRRRRKPA
ncbi:MAG: hypothetical protein F4052_03065 [Dehalococcoidia bacterium]|nr:hypothetical protein [Dehalococcoidia bacterium]MYK25922.1 hypothetical protein [Dehalococcoidia bacterium]